MRDIGIPVKPPKTECNDNKCPFHGKLPVRTKVLEGKVVSAKMQRTVIVQKDYLH
ncbi:30S ribosomal protein S17, partial [Candidatus Bathyarchaeota archaeon]